MGLPLITTDFPGCREVVEEGLNGFLIPAHDSNALARAILKLTDSRETRQRFGQASRQRVVHRFDLSVITGQLRHIYLQLLTQKGLVV